MSKPVCVIVGIGPGNGAAFARKFHNEGYAVALLSRKTDYSKQLEQELESSQSYACDVSDVAQIQSVFDQISQELGPVDTLLYNAGAGHFRNIENATMEDFEIDWQVNVRGCAAAAQAVIPKMIEAGKGNIVVSGATASLKGGANFAPFASSKAGQRNLVQSMARHLGPKGIHVAYVIIDAVIALPRTREAMPDKPDEFFIRPDDIANSVYFLTQQTPTGWTFELDLRPAIEKW